MPFFFLFFFSVFGFCFVFVFVIFWWDGLLWFPSSSSPLFFWHSNASLVIRDHLCLCVFFWFVCSGFFLSILVVWGVHWLSGSLCRFPDVQCNLGTSVCE